MNKHKFWCILAEIDPLYDVIRGVKNPKMSFWDLIRTFFNHSLWNLAKLLRMEKRKFWCILTEIDPLHDVIRGSKMSKNRLFWPKSFSFQTILTKVAKNVENGKTQILVYFDPHWPPLWRHNRGSKCPKITFFDRNRPFFNQSWRNFAKV